MQSLLAKVWYQWSVVKSPLSKAVVNSLLRVSVVIKEEWSGRLGQTIPKESNEGSPHSFTNLLVFTTPSVVMRMK